MSNFVLRLCTNLGGYARRLVQRQSGSVARDLNLLQAIEDAEGTDAAGPSDQSVKDYAERVLSLQEHARELSLLGLTGRNFTAEIYADALGEHLGLDIRIVRASIYDADIRNLGTTTYDIENGLVTISVTLRLGWWLYQYALHHELGHVAAGHPLPIRARNGEITGFKEPTRRIARRPPVTRASATSLSKNSRLRLYEAEAELRARRGMLAGSLGSTVVQTSILTQVR